MQRSEIRKIDALIGARVREGRKLAGVSLTRLSEKLCITFQQLQKYEAGTNRMSAGTLKVIADSLNKDIAYFYQDIGGEVALSRLPNSLQLLKIAQLWRTLSLRQRRCVINLTEILAESREDSEC